jgi:hypothetical protein
MNEKERSEARARNLRLTKIAKAMAFFTTLILTCMTAKLVAAESQSDTAKVPCKVQRIDLPDFATMKLPDGEHVIAGANTEKGKLEVRVVVKKDMVTGPDFYIGGKRLKRTPAERIKPPLLDCLEEGLQCPPRQATAPPSDGWFSTAVQGMFAWILPSAEARFFRCYVMSTSCYDNDCCVATCCSSDRSFECARWCTDW